jgi:hypothetical protein
MLMMWVRKGKRVGNEDSEKGRQAWRKSDCLVAMKFSSTTLLTESKVFFFMASSQKHSKERNVGSFPTKREQQQKQIFLHAPFS